MVTASVVMVPVSEAAKPLTLQDIMKFESLTKPVISDNGSTLAVEAKPDRGDSRVIIKVLNSSKSFDIKDAAKPKISADGRFVAMVKSVPLLKQVMADAKEKKKLKSGLILLDTQSGEQQVFEKVNSFEFNKTGSHLLVRFDVANEDKNKDDRAVESKKTEKGKSVSNDKVKVDKFDQGYTIKLIALAKGNAREYKDVTAYHFDKYGKNLVLAINDIKSKVHKLDRISLSSNQTQTLFKSDSLQIGSVATSNNGEWAAFTSGKAEDLPYGREYQLNLVSLADNKVTPIRNNSDWKINRYSTLSFSKNSKRLFFGRVPEVSQQLSLAKINNVDDLYNVNIIDDERKLRVWNGDDPLIKPNEIKQYKKELKRTYLAVFDLEKQDIVQLGDTQVKNVQLSEQPTRLLAKTDKPYQKMITWAGFYSDYYLVDIDSGKQTKVLTQYPTYWQPSLSPKGNYLAYYYLGNIYLYDVASKTKTNVSKGLKVGFANEDHDYPSNPPGYGFGPWIDGEKALLVYDKYDIWRLDITSGKMTKLTNGRKQKVQYRVTGLAKTDEPTWLKSDEKVLLKGYNDRTKSDDFYRLNLAGGTEQLTAEPVKLKVLARSKNAKTLIYSKERYDIFPDLFAAKDYLNPQQAEQLTNLNKQIESFNWGSAELVQWTNSDGKSLDGVLIKPANYQDGKRVPVLVYYYRFMSDRLHSFPDMKLNHRPNFAWFVDNGYAVFLPDIRFEVGYPGSSSVKALTSGVQHLIDIGVADPKAIGIQGHSWAGYQTAYAVTQTNIFAAAVSGAPVSNMTSAYSGIRHASGLARQFQYESGQSRIGKPLYADPLKYIENSPVFYADRIQTPMMIMFGDKDGAVPWEQGIEMYLAMRRAGKDVVMLQYQGEPHHLKQYPNKLDYSIKMMQYFDHYLKGKPAPKWLSKGEAYYEYKKN
ncbi:S9 family peptidase [Parashewanella curva]|uniref:S9 family peptidase n=2 Tax=Parashewanella curva TaxID=2338552 RepID=A0A3L8Q0P5_9GAMM|nr:prolyl oligopeptidase family serine peptidase [Parashewanella curva]RLV59952.1 S9 family peptidase [Parashewanella curva]